MASAPLFFSRLLTGTAIRMPTSKAGRARFFRREKKPRKTNHYIRQGVLSAGLGKAAARPFSPPFAVLLTE
jgi:hypothetical protein